MVLMMRLGGTPSLWIFGSLYGKPEVIVLGLPQKVMTSLKNSGLPSYGFNGVLGKSPVYEDT
jgi:hypothetical protein